MAVFKQLLVVAAIGWACAYAPMATAEDYFADQGSKQILLSEALVSRYLEVVPRIWVLDRKIGYPGDEAGHPAETAEREAFAKAHGFASYAEYHDVSVNIYFIILATEVDRYDDPLEHLEKLIAETNANTTMAAEDKARLLAEMTAELATTPTLAYKDNAVIVAKYKPAIDVKLKAFATETLGIDLR